MKFTTSLLLSITLATCGLSGATGHKGRLSRPIQLGTSGGSTVDSVDGSCCSGTLGSLVQDSSGKLYILSNTHVFAGDSSPGGNGRVATKGDPINQPGYIDVNCQNKSSDYVAKLSNWVKIVPNGTTAADAAIAEIMPGQVDSKGAIMEIGTISSTPVDAFVGQKVKKSGRTSGLTRGKISGLNATITVEYTDECGGDEYESTFVGQILITPGSFLQGGDSGSLLVEDVGSNPRPIGLCFAGSSSVSIANPINDVLKALNVSMVGTPSSSTAVQNLAILTRPILAVQKLHGPKLLAIDGVIGHAVGTSQKDATKPVILAIVKEATPAVVAKLPKNLQGVPVEVLEVGHVKAL
ncbi:MAG: hypothetical protein JSR37_03485 [Verrucomicrobia bacterium]|nr:hypothetical protein [Verrucomicrobiota bacterium]MBS0636453.1 hypothetical protein [Verrucomicrobiota bacterium]